METASATIAAAPGKYVAALGNLNDLTEYRLVYVASPYSDYPPGLDRAFSDIGEVTWWMHIAGVSHFSPIIYAHPLAKVWGVERKDSRFWLGFCESMMNASDALVVVELDGWADSYGITVEIEDFKAAGKPVYFMNPVTLELRLND